MCKHERKHPNTHAYFCGQRKANAIHVYIHTHIHTDYYITIVHAHTEYVLTNQLRLWTAVAAAAAAVVRFVRCVFVLVGVTNPFAVIMCDWNATRSARPPRREVIGLTLCVLIVC